MEQGLRTTRAAEERSTDAILTLVVLAALQRVRGHDAGDRLQVTKHLFLLAYALFQRRIKAFNFSFYRYLYGPFTPEVYETWESLRTGGLLELSADQRGPLSVTEKGVAVADEFTRVVLHGAESSKMADYFRPAKALARMPTGSLVEHVYQARVQPVGWHQSVTIREVPSFVYLTRVLEPREASQEVHIPARWHRHFQLLQLDAWANAVGDDVPVLDGLTAAQLRRLDEALEKEEKGLLHEADLDLARSRYGI